LLELLQQEHQNDLEKQCQVEIFDIALRWLKTVSSTFQDIDFDGSLSPLFIN